MTLKGVKVPGTDRTMTMSFPLPEGFVEDLLESEKVKIDGLDEDVVVDALLDSPDLFEIIDGGMTTSAGGWYEGTGDTPDTDSEDYFAIMEDAATVIRDSLANGGSAEIKVD